MEFDIKPEASVLLISSSAREHEHLHNLFQGSHWTTRHAKSCREGLTILKNEHQPIVLCDEVLEDGDWRGVLSGTQFLKRPPVIVVSASESSATLWAEVLHLGAYDLLERPFQAQDLFWTLSSAWMHTAHQWERA